MEQHPHRLPGVRDGAVWGGSCEGDLGAVKRAGRSRYSERGLGGVYMCIGGAMEMGGGGSRDEGDGESGGKGGLEAVSSLFFFRSLSLCVALFLLSASFVRAWLRTEQQKSAKRETL